MYSNKLESVLQNFQGVTNIKDKEQKLSELSQQFNDIAMAAFSDVCLEINGIRRIYPMEIEFYYHEEGEEGLKDPVMYHTCDHEHNKALPYFTFGSFNCHTSGIDVTFENEKKTYRASFLIRAYRVCEYDGKKWVETKPLECRSTYLYEDMLMNLSLFNGINVRWLETKTDSSPTLHIKPRVNVADYQTTNKGEYIKIEITQEEYNNLEKEKHKKYFSYSGKKLKRCTRLWNYSLLAE